MPKAKLLILLAAFGALSVLFVSSVEAHVRPIRFDPAPGAVLNSAPSSITGWFTGEIRRAEESFIQVLDANGANVATGETQVSDDRGQMSVGLQPGLGEGRYIVYWSALDDGDGHAVGACYAFFVGQAAADAAVENNEMLDAPTECPYEESDHADGNGATAPPDGSSASISIDISVSGSDAELMILPVNFTPRAPDGNTVDPNFGHYHIYLDKVPVDVISGSHSHDEEEGDEHETDEEAGPDTGGGLVENPAMWVENSFTFTDLVPGAHTVTVVLNHDDHTPLDPPVIASQTFIVGGSSGGDDSDGIPAWALIAALGGGLVVGGLGVKLAGSRG